MTAGAWTLSAAAVPLPTDQVAIPVVGTSQMLVADPELTDPASGPARAVATSLPPEAAVTRTRPVNQAGSAAARCALGEHSGGLLKPAPDRPVAAAGAAESDPAHGRPLVRCGVRGWCEGLGPGIRARYQPGSPPFRPGRHVGPRHAPARCCGRDRLRDNGSAGRGRNNTGRVAIGTCGISAPAAGVRMASVTSSLKRAIEGTSACEVAKEPVLQGQ